MTQMSETDDTTVQGARGETTHVLGRTVDWVVTALLVLGGVLFGLLGVFLNSVANRAEIARLVADGTIESTVLSDAELVNVTYAMAWWGGLGLAVMGVLLVVGGVAFLAYRRRIRQRREEMGVTEPDTTTNAIVGAVVSVVGGFIPFAPVIGGAVAGYLERADRMAGARVGGLSGLVASVPIFVLFAFLIGGLFVVSAEISFGIGAASVALVLAIALLVAVVYMVLLGAVGGYIGAYLREDRMAAA
ncbi:MULTISPECIES: DUF5518 domain-containing protein [Salinibaculum]|uniref:DUF5518 domain-containing protein n=1 Tax=Salinibaculum TaxID=2732368 RepID=UPI0030D2C2B7